jgi:rhamnosyltransferase
VSGSVILYNPDRSVIRHILSYIDFVDRLYVMDNSDQACRQVVEAVSQLPKVRFVSMNGNQGVAKALNTALFLAVSHGYAWMICFDQDTWLTENILVKLFQCLERYDKARVGMVCARYTKKDRYVEFYGNGCNELLVSITAGSMINLTVFRKMGPFMDKLFIDHVDHEYCLRLRRHGYKIIQASNAFICHQLGNSRRYLFCRSSNHSPFRWYFMTRNRFYVACLYKKDLPRFFRTEMVRFAVEVIKILVFESQKFEKLKYMVMGYQDFRKNRFDRVLSDL